MFTNAFLLGTLSVAVFTLLYSELPRRIRNILKKHYLATGLIVKLLTYLLMGGGFTVLLAAAIACIETSILLSIMKDEELSRLCSKLVDKLVSLKDKTVELIKDFAKESTTETQY